MAKKEVECPPEWKHDEKAWREGYRKGQAVRKALKKYAAGGRVDLLQRAIDKAHAKE